MKFRHIILIDGKRFEDSKINKRKKKNLLSGEYILFLACEFEQATKTKDLFVSEVKKVFTFSNIT